MFTYANITGNDILNSAFPRDEFDLFVPWYEPTEGGRYQYQVVIKSKGVKAYDSQNNEYVSNSSDILTVTFHNYMTGNIEYGFYSKNLHFLVDF